MTVLSNSTLSEITSLETPHYDRATLRAGIAHFGVGNFVRTHLAVYVHELLQVGGSQDWGIAGIGLSDGEAARAKAATFARQDCLYSLTEFDPDGTSTSRVIGSVIDYLHAPSDPAAVLNLLADPGLRIVSLTITEGGYFVDPETGQFDADASEVDRDAENPLPATVFGFIVQALRRRRDAGLPGLTVMSCDNLPHNGQVAKRAVLGFARAIDPDLCAWIEAEVTFPNSMVDRVAPYVSSEQRARLNAATGLDDELPVPTESYLQWVLEDHFAAGRPDFARVGVEYTEDVGPWENAKLRVLNASHVLTSYPSVLLGHRVINQAMNDPAVLRLADTFLTQDAIPLVQAPEGLDLFAYKDSVLARFGNRAIEDQVLRVATDGAQKLAVFLSTTVRELLARGGDTRRVALAFACYQGYLQGLDERGERFEVTEPHLSALDRETIAAADGLGLLRIPAFADLKLLDSPSFVTDFLQSSQTLRISGVEAGIDQAVAER